MAKPQLPSRRETELMSILINGEQYGRQLRDSFADRTGQSLPLGSLYTTLDRLEDKGFIRSRDGEPDPERGGNRRRFFELTASGHRALNAIQQWAAGLTEVRNAQR